MSQNIIINDIISEHRERMLNLKKYYPFFKLSEISFSWYKEGLYDCLDMGYILMAVLRYFIEENNFREHNITYQEYAKFMRDCIIRDFGIKAPDEDMKVLIEYIFNKLKNDGKPFSFEYFDPVDRKKKISRIRLIDSKVEDEMVYYFISSDGIEFYLDTKEIKDESKISIEQLLLEKMIRSQDFGGGVKVIKRINQEVERLWHKKNQVMSLLSADVLAGIEAYEEFFKTGVRWFEEEQKLFTKNTELIKNALKKAESDRIPGDGVAYLKKAGEIYQLDTELKIAMNNHSRLLSACTSLGILADEMIKKSKLNRLRPKFDFKNALELLMKKDDISGLEILVKPVLGLNVKKNFNLLRLEDIVTLRAEREEAVEKIEGAEAVEIVFEDELEEQRIKDNYAVLMRLLLLLLKKEQSFDLNRFNEYAQGILGDHLYENGDYYSFLVNLCRKKEYVIEKSEKSAETFFDGIIKEYVGTREFEPFVGMSFQVTTAGGDEELIRLQNESEITNIWVSRL